MFKFFGGTLVGFVVGIITAFALVFAFGDYEDTPPEVVIGPSPTPTEQPTATATLEAVSIAAPAVTVAPTVTPTPLPTLTLAPVATPTTAPVAMNTDIIVDGIRWRATGVEELGNLLHSDNDFVEDATTTGKFVRVFMEIESRQSEPVDYWHPGLADGQGRRYDAFDDSVFYLTDETNCHVAQFNPGITRQCAEIFEVANDAGGYKLIVNDFDWLDTSEAIIELR